MSARPLVSLPLHDRFYRVAFVCGAAPLLAGISVFLLWLLTRWGPLMVTGVLTICAGFGAFVMGCIALAIYCWRGLRSRDSNRRPVWLPTFVCAGLLLVNFPVAFGIVEAVIDVEMRYVVVIHNASGQPLDDVRVFGGGCDESFGSLAPGKTVRRRLRFRTDGDLQFRAVSGTTTLEANAGYVTRDLAGAPTITVEPDGTVSVVEDFD